MNKISNLTPRQKKLLYFISKNKQPKTLKELIKYFNLSERTIRKEIFLINKEFENTLITCSRNKGYFINEVYLDAVNKKVDDCHYDENELRIYKIFNLLFKKRKISLNSLASKIYVSSSTLRKEILKLNQEIEDDLIIINKGFCAFNDDLFLRRRLFFRIVKKVVQENFDILETKIFTIFNSFSLKEIEKIETTNTNLSLPQGMIFNRIDTKILAICIYVCLSLNKIEDDEKNDISITGEFIHFLNLLKVEYPDLKEVDLYILNELISSFCLKDNEEITVSPLTEVIFEEFAQDVFEKYSINIMNSEILSDNLLKHIEYMLKRVKNNFQTYNPLLNEIKRNYPYAYEISLLLIHIVYCYFNFYMNEHEISYVALYLEYFLVKENKKIKALMISNQRKSIENLFLEWIETNFSNQLEIVSIIKENEKENLSLFDGIDLVFSFKSIDFKGENYIFNSLPTQRDNLRLKSVIHNIKFCYRLKNILKKMITKDSIYFFKKDVKLEDVFKKISLDLKKHNYIDDAKMFVEDLLDREKYYPSNLTNDLMIPHGLKYFSNKNCVSVAILKKPLNQVKLIFLLALTEKRSDEINVLYDYFKILANNLEFRNKLSNVEDKNEFIELLLNVSKLSDI